MWEPKRDLPPFLFEAADRVRETVYWQTWRFGELGQSKRSERLEAIVLVLLVLIYRTDLISGRVGTPPKVDDEWFRGITADYIARWTGMRLGRVTRALDDLRWAGFITSLQPREVDEATGEYTGLAAVRNITMKLWTRLRLKNEYDAARNYACKKKRDERHRVRERTSKVRRARRRLAAKVSRLAGGTTPAATSTSPTQLLYHRMAALREQHPDMGLRELRELAEKLI
jgi:membrane peptidoglycan carboxypeptidase